MPELPPPSGRPLASPPSLLQGLVAGFARLTLFAVGTVFVLFFVCVLLLIALPWIGIFLWARLRGKPMPLGPIARGVNLWWQVDAFGRRAGGMPPTQRKRPAAGGAGVAARGDVTDVEPK